MNIEDNKAWDDAVYTLLYPGILGSMIFNATEFFRGAQPFDWFHIAQVLIVVLFGLDYLHMYADLRPTPPASRCWVIVDGLIPVLFGIASWSMGRKDFKGLFIPVAFAMFLVLIYPHPPQFRKVRYVSGKLFAFIIAVAALVCSASHHFLGGPHVAWSLGVVVVAYAIHVFGFTEWAKASG